MKYWLIILLSVFSLASNGQNIVVLVTDSDGFANIRENPKADAKIVGTVKSGDFAHCGNCKDYWCEILTNNGIGYIHKSRIEAVLYLPDSVQQALITNTFKQLQINATNFNNAHIHKDTVAHIKTVKILEAYEDERYDPMLQIFPSYFCRTKDTIALNLLFATIMSNTGSANEQPAWTLGYCFKCQSELMISQLKKIKTQKNFRYIAGDIEFGLMNVFGLPVNANSRPEDNTPKKVAQFDALMKKLKDFLK